MTALTYEVEILTQTKIVQIKYYRVLDNKGIWKDKIRNQGTVQNLKITTRKAGKFVVWTCVMNAGSLISFERVGNGLIIDH